MKKVLAAVFALFLSACQVLWAINPPKKAKKAKKANEDSLIVLEPGQSYFKPTLRLSGIGLDRKDMSEKLFQTRTQQLIDGATFSIMRDPRALKWAEAINRPNLQVIFSSAAQEYGFPKETLEAISFVESGGDPNAESPTGPKGIMQFTKKTGESVGLKQYYETRTKLVPQRKLLKKATKGQPAVYKELPPKKVKYKVLVADDRLDPRKAIRAAAKFLAGLTQKYGRVDLAVWGYHSGEGYPNRALNLARKYGIKELTMAKIFFGNSPAWNRDLFSLLAVDADYGSTYFFTVKRAEQLIAMYRTAPESYKALLLKYANPITEGKRTPNRLWVWYSLKDAYATNDDLVRASNKEIFPVPHFPQFFSYALRTVGPEAIGAEDPKNRQLFLQDPPEVIGALEYVAFETRRLWEEWHPKKEKFVALEVTSLIRNLVYQKLLGGNPNSHVEFPTHCVGAVDVSYLRLPPWEAACLKFVIQDMGWDEYISYFLESTARKTMHFGPSPAHKDFFLSIYHEAQKNYPAKR